MFDREEIRMRLKEYLIECPTGMIELSKETGLAVETLARLFKGYGVTYRTLMKIEKFLQEKEDQGLAALADDTIKTENKEDYEDIKELRKDEDTNE